MHRKSVRTLLLAFVLSSLTGAALAQDQPPVFEFTEQISFDRPEAWALKRATSLTLFTGVTAPEARELGAFEFAIELGWNPSVSEEDRRVGFNGRKKEDFNRLDVVPRPRLMIGLGREFTLELSYIPPVEIEGLEPNIFAAAVERPFLHKGNLTLAARVSGQMATVKGDITCPEDEARIAAGNPGNEFGCEAPSTDEATLNYAGAAIVGGYRISTKNDSAITFGVYANYMDLEFQVDALTFGIRDRTKLVTDGWTYALTGGVSLPVSQRLRIAVEAFYSPLDVDRPIFDIEGQPLGVDRQDDELFNLRSMLSYSF